MRRRRRGVLFEVWNARCLQEEVQYLLLRKGRINLHLLLYTQLILL